MADLHFPRATRAAIARRRALAPETEDAFRAYSKAVFTEGALDRRTKQPIAVAVAHVTQCIEGHVKGARNAGDRAEQIMEAIRVAAEMRAGASYAPSLKALDVLVEAEA
ncbi:carboxymuconolactone decarboxylase family protein [Acidimangrovimonas pyrenivorans]|uniref:Carboxymuconolactone decarboxylase family protein n=1 Tax=Acidimangrovimonas pyrenivorans TaxID=2030798 RepID=A0ABV7AG10_9RHOB